ncbi:MAG: ComEA family DNA-binding protein [Anaerolineales bacterium]|nr:ComEA family DNA-binding protein [Anaerolineales bacterium]
MKTFLYITMGVLIGLLAAGVIWIGASQPRGEGVTLLPSPTLGSLMVYVTGAVATPGVYSLPEGSRVNDAVLFAGGFLPNAEQEGINLAAPLQDGQQLDIPIRSSASHVSGGRININTATVEELDTLPGIGPTTAKSIVNYRLEHGPFQFPQDIQNVPGIGPVTYDKIKDLIKVGP